MPIMWGLAIGAAMGGGIAALQGKKMDDVLKGAALGGATGALGGALAPATGLVGGATAEAATVAMPIAESTITSAPLAETFNAGIAGLPNSGVVVNGSQLIGNQIPSVAGMFPNAASPLSGAASNVPTIANTALNQGVQTAAPAGTGFFDSGIGKLISDNPGKTALGAGALGLMALKPQGGTNQEQDSFIRPYSYNPTNQIYTAQTPIKASEFGARTFADGGDVSDTVTTQAQRVESNPFIPAAMQQSQSAASNPTLEAIAAMQQAQPAYQSQGIAQPLIQPQMAQIQQRYAAPQRQAPEAFQYQAPSFVKYSNTIGGTGVGGGSSGGGGGSGFVPNATGGGSSGLEASGINALYQQYLGRDADPTGLRVNAGQTADTIRQSILASPEYQSKNPSGSIGSLYQELLGRAPDPTGIAANAGQSEQTIRESILASPEYQSRVETGQAPQPVNNVFIPYDERQPNTEYPDYVGQYYDFTGGGDADGGLIADKHPRYAMGGNIGGYYPEPDDGGRNFGGIGNLNKGPQYPMQTIGYAMGGHLGGYSDGGQLLKGPGDGVSDDIPAQIGDRQPARLADGEFVVPARIVSELGNGSTDAGAKRLYAMMDRIQKNRGKTVGKGKVAVNSKSDKYLPA